MSMYKEFPETPGWAAPGATVESAPATAPAPAPRKLTADSIQVGGSHYKDLDPQPWDVMQTLLSPEEFRGFLKGNMIKYAMRQGRKDSPDAGKYHHYKQKLREVSGGDTWT